MTRPRALLAALILTLLPRPSAAHVGSPDVIFEGSAGAYPVRVNVRPPGVIPGLADVTVRLLGAPADAVTIQPIDWHAPAEGGAPPPDLAKQVRGAPALWTGALWLMSQGSYAVRVEVRGALGAGTVLVPVAAASVRTLEMTGTMRAVLLVLAGLLFGGASSIVGAAAGEAVVPVGETPDRSRRLRGRVAMGLAFVVLSLAVWGGRRWWDAVDAGHRAALYRPLALSTSVRPDGALRLALDADGESARSWGALAPDHGKLMHLFLVREPGLDALAHLHPVPQSRQRVFEVPLPPLPSGRYRVYADVTHESGFAQTLTGTVVVPPLPATSSRASGLAPDPDDSWHAGQILGSISSSSAALADGYALVREDAAPLPEKQDVSLRFRVVNADGVGVTPEPYMGMLAHAALTRDDGAVFVHLHPSGTISMASQQLFDARESAGPPAVDPHAAHRASASETVLSFPYAFPQAGRYRIWVQVKVDGVVRTGTFDLSVGAKS